MRWMVFALATLAAMAADALLGHVLAIHAQGAPLRPSVLPALAVFIALAAPRLTVLWACLVLGALLDLATPMMVGGHQEPARLLGPSALGFVFGGYFVYQIRAVVFRRRALTIGALTVMLSVAASLVTVMIFVIHDLYPGEPVLHWKSGSAAGALLMHLLISLYSGLLAIPVGWLLLTSSALWGFHGATRHRSWR